MLTTAIRVVLLIASGAALGVGNHLVRHGELAAHPPPPAVACGEGDLHPTNAEPGEAAGLCSAPGVLVLDARPADQYAAGHIAGAVHLPCHSSALAPDLVGKVGAAGTILVYGHDTADATRVAETLVRRGAADVRVIRGGYAAWEAAGLACSSGACEDCLHGHLTRGEDL